MKRQTLIWDGLVRSFHFLFAVGFLAAYVIAKILGEDSSAFPFHMILGLTIGLMAILRIIWLVVGTKWAKVTGLSLNPLDLLTYTTSVFSKESKQYSGHNPATSITMVLMLLLALSLAFTGYAYTQGNESFKEIHPILANLFLFTVILHVAGIILHSFVHQDGIALGMLDGKKVAPEEDGIKNSAPIAAAVFVAVSLFFFGSLLYSFSPATGTTKWPITGQIIQPGENEGEGQEGREGGEEEGSESGDDND